MSTEKQEVRAVNEPSRSWGWLMALGIFFVLLGAIGLSMVVGLTLASMLFLGILLIIAGCSQIVDVFKSKHWRAVIWHAFIAVLYIVGGGLVIYDPLLASSLITLMLATVLIVIGLSRFIMASTLKGSSAFILILAGIIAIALGVMIIMQWPISGLWVIGLFIAVELMVDGWAYIFLAIAMRRSR
ncbi:MULTISPECIES: HdeD family acid-resistance protein [Legionella]|uniref:Acid-resistance membrane protein n=1 Tax=Legionella quinlivanii TaxID=45073 RepID=A0A364LIW8_9GAMM|nr:MULTISPECIES: DUF308 domain-containing protein [Legionella]MCE3044915.1 DUF308 domain-containing protein [Legionella sp. 16cNR16C]RAP36355.1 hypothetical protein B1207_09465 [Legionella quinlivanii]